MSRFGRISSNKLLGEFACNKGVARYVVPTLKEITWELATIVKAIIGAVWVDSGCDTAAVKRAFSAFADAHIG